MLSGKSLKKLEELEKNKEVINVLTSRENDLLNRLIKSYKEVMLQVPTRQISQAQQF
ncbi:MAG TPA: hypothetical protein VLH37_02590 [Bacteroidales bacterium]|nr:hypothetical protein [Bacteroidales bacterium]